ncbi:MAG: glycoside hydrolase family 9 protein [Balneolaceae bacterium]
MKTLPFYILFVLGFMTGCNQLPEKKFIAVNQVGYEKDSPKQAYLINAEATWFELVRTYDSKVVFSDSMKASDEKDSVTGDKISVIDFTEYNSDGEFVIRAGGIEPVISNSFNISQNVYSEALQVMSKSFYYHRCGTQVGYESEWGYEICHVDDAPFFDDQSTSINVSGGWHDAGDYNKFTVNTALSAALLLYAYETRPEHFWDNQLGIPESGNGIPDLLDEVSWALEWLLKMQRDDGAVYHKVSQKKWIGEYLPHTDPSMRYIFDISSAATASFTAAAAVGSRHLRNYNPDLSQELESAAERAWNWLKENPDNVPAGGFKNPEGISGGEYNDPSDLAERLWAAIEFYKLTNHDSNLSFFIDNYRKLYQNGLPPISWRDANSMALRAFLRSETSGEYLEDKDAVREAMIRQANNLLEVHNKNRYKNLLRSDQYYWGSNSVGLAYAFDLIQAYKITGHETYKNAALDQLHFILGRNPLNISQVTGVGSAPVQHPYHQLSEMGHFNGPVPGMLVGGPNNYRLLNDRKISPYPAKNYEDVFKNYLVNEPAINFTAILVYVTSALSTPTNPTENYTNSTRYHIIQ